MTIDEVLELLVANGYQDAGTELLVSGVNFEFRRVLFATDRRLDVVLVEQADPASFSRRVQGLGRALDLAGSRRTLTAVWLGEGLAAEVEGEIESSARLIDVGRDGRSPLDVLLPLPMPSVTSETSEPLAELREAIGLDPEVRESIDEIAKERFDSESVRRELRRWILEPLESDHE